MLVPERVPEQIADAVARLLSDPELTHRMSTSAQQRVQRDLSREASAARFSALFESLAANAKPADARASRSTTVGS